MPDLLKVLDKWGSPETYPHMAAGWAVAFDSPFEWTKQVASSFGGTRNGMVVHWPKGIKAKNETPQPVPPRDRRRADDPRSGRAAGAEDRQRHAAGPDRGREHDLHLRRPKAKDRHTTQYFEIFGNRAIYHDGWLAGTVHRAPWEMKPRHALAGGRVGTLRRAQRLQSANDLAAKQPEKLKELQTLFLKEAEKYHVLPLDDRGVERANAAMAGRPDLMRAEPRSPWPKAWPACRKTFSSTSRTSRSRSRPTSRSRRAAATARSSSKAAGSAVGPVHARRQAGLSLQFPWPSALHDRCLPRRCRRAKPRSSSTSSTTAAVWAREAWGRSSSTARKPPRAASR